jgi:hypothetical protein
MPNRRKYTDEQIAEVLKELAVDGYAPTKTQLNAAGYGWVANQINHYGGWVEFAKKAGLKTRNKKHAPRSTHSIEELMVILLEIAEDGYLPTHKELKAHGYGSYYHFMFKNGGTQRFAELTGLQLRRKKWDYEKVMTNLIQLQKLDGKISIERVREVYGGGMVSFMARHHSNDEWRALVDIASN